MTMTAPPRESEMDILFPVPDGRRNADDMGLPPAQAAPAPSAEPPAMDDLRVRLHCGVPVYPISGASMVNDANDTMREAADALATLRATVERQAREMAELQRKLTNEENYYEDMKIRAGRAEAERDALREDAERYRWLRDHKGNNREPHIAQHPYCAEIDAVEYPYFVKVGLDAAIDAARAKVKP